MSRDDALLRAVGLERRYGEVTALTEVDVALARGDALALLGPNGAGKTTLLSLLAGVDRPTEGTLDWGGTTVGWVPHRPALYGRLTTRENLVLFADLEGADDPDATADELIGRADLGPYAARRADQLSTGTLQRLNLSVALAGRPNALLLEEPTATLSADQRIRLW
ncbi:MAG: ATP-binding cassette domain-containing protein, partial [Miltoncostaeaceae bacterium]